jgi:hypothetical protein
MATRIQVRRDSTSNWSDVNPVLADGEIGIEKTNPPKVKIGDGITAWNSLPYVTTSGGGGTWGSIIGTLADQTDLNNALSNKVDKVTGKGLSTEDYTTLEQTKVSELETSMLTTSFSNSILLDKISGRNYGTVDLTSNATIALDSTNIKDGGNAQLGLKADGTHSPVLTSFNKYDASGLDYDTTLNTVNSFAFFRWLGKVYYNILDQYISTGPLTLSAPGSFTTTSTTAASISLSWTAVSNASSYKLEWSANGTTSWTQIGGTLSQATTTYSHTSLTASTLYYYRISSIGDGVNYLTSGFATSNTTVLTPTTLTAPTVTGSALGQTSLRFSWSNITNNSGYRYRISTDGGGTFGTPIDLGTGVTSFDITGLTTGTRRDVQVLTLGDGVTYLNSAYSTTANSTTSSLTQLATPTLNTPTVISGTELDLGWSTVSNITSWKLEWSANGTTGWTQIGGIIGVATLSYNHTSLTAGTQYFYRLTAIGDGVTYSDSNASSVVNNTTTIATPTFVSSATSIDGLTVSVVYSKLMPASPTYTGLSFTGSTSGSHSPTAAIRNGSNTSQVDYTIAVACVNGETITAAYTPGNIVSNDGGILAGFSPQSVTNNVVGIPIASNLSITGSIGVGNTLTGHYIYSGGTEGISTYRWLTSITNGGTQTAIGGATSVTLIITSDLIDKYLYFEVTPKASGGQVGSTVQSSSLLLAIPLPITLGVWAWYDIDDVQITSHNGEDVITVYNDKSGNSLHMLPAITNTGAADYWTTKARRVTHAGRTQAYAVAGAICGTYLGGLSKSITDYTIIADYHCMTRGGIISRMHTATRDIHIDCSNTSNTRIISNVGVLGGYPYFDYSTDVHEIVTTRKSGTELALWKRKTKYTGSVTDTWPQTISIMSIFGYYTAIPFLGYFEGIMFFDRALTDQEISDIQDWKINRCGIV